MTAITVGAIAVALAAIGAVVYLARQATKATARADEATDKRNEARDEAVDAHARAAAAELRAGKLDTDLALERGSHAKDNRDHAAEVKHLDDLLAGKDALIHEICEICPEALHARARAAGFVLVSEAPGSAAGGEDRDVAGDGVPEATAPGTDRTTLRDGR